MICPNIIKQSLCNMFADDNVLTASGKSFTHTKNKLQESIYSANNWYENNRLTVNILKTLSMVSASIPKLKELQDQHVTLDLKLNDITLTQVSESPYLGLCIQNSLKWDSQIQKLCRSVCYKLSLLNRLRKFMNKELLNKIFIIHIRPCIEYGLSVWGHCSESNKALVQRLQHRAARIILGNFDFINVRGHDLVHQLGWQTIDQRRDYYVATLMHKCIYETAPIHLSNEITRTIHTHDLTTRAASNGDLHVPESKCETFKQSFQYQGAILWNNLPSELRNIADINEFKYFYKQMYF